MAATVTTPDNWVMTAATNAQFKGLSGMLISKAHPYITLIKDPPHHFTLVHSHEEPETMFILEGRIMLNGHWAGPGTIIEIDANHEYWHTTGAEGCVIALVRPRIKGANNPGLQIDLTEPAAASAAE